LTSYASPVDATLIKPPAKPRVGPDQQPIPGSLPPAGAGSITPLQPGGFPAPAPGLDNQLQPFPGGIQPLMAPQVPNTPAAPDANLAGTMIAPAAPTTFNAGPSISPVTAGAAIQPPGTIGPAINPGSDPRVDQYRGMLDKAAGDLSTTDRRGMLNSLLSDFDASSLERDNNLMTLSGRKSAAFGRIGSGMAGQDVQNIARMGMADRQRFRNTLAADTIDKEIGDRFGKASMFRGLAGDEINFGRDNRNELRGERGYADNRGDLFRDEARGERGYFDSRGDLGRSEARGERSWQYGVDRDNYGAGQDWRNELRGERGYQDSREAYDTDRGIQERELSERFTDSAFNRDQARLNAGRAGNPAGAYAGAASDLRNESGGTMNALMQYLQSLGIFG
jgi:hypothetical protein